MDSEGLRAILGRFTPKIGGRPPKEGVLPPKLGVDPPKNWLLYVPRGLRPDRVWLPSSQSPGSIEAHLGGYVLAVLRKTPIWVDFSLWLWWKNLGQGLGFCNFRPGKLPHTGAFTSVRRDLL